MALDYATIVKQANAVLSRYSVPLTLRQLYYRLVAVYGLPNRLQSYKSLGSMMVRAREHGDVDWRRIEDRNREAIGDVGFSSPKSFRDAYADAVEDLAEQYRRNLWLDQDTYVEVWVEKDALSRVFSSAAGPFGVVTCPSRGYSSFSFIMEAVLRIKQARKMKDREVHILHFSDFDPSGLDMGHRLSRYGAGDFEVHRIALTQDQIQEHSLPPAPVKMSDSRAGRFIEEHGADVVELDALDPDILTRIIEEAIQERMDEDVFEASKKKMAREQRELKNIFAEAAERIREG